jgi:hypothetical protein
MNTTVVPARYGLLFRMADRFLANHVCGRTPASGASALLAGKASEECAVRWSVGIEAEAGRVLTREQVVELADAVAASGGVASGIGTSRYGARLIVQADSRDEAVARATEEFSAAAAKAGLPPGPVVRTEAVSEDEDAEDAAP